MGIKRVVNNMRKSIIKKKWRINLIVSYNKEEVAEINRSNIL